MMQDKNSCFGEVANNISLQEIYQTTRKNKLMKTQVGRRLMA
jgi:hypothetical protein